MLTREQVQRLMARQMSAEAAADWAEIEADSQARAARMAARRRFVAPAGMGRALLAEPLLTGTGNDCSGSA